MHPTARGPLLACTLALSALIDPFWWLTIHRSTLRYRLRRIRDLTGHDLGAVEHRSNLHVASRAWRVLGGPGAARVHAGPPGVDRGR